MRPNMELHAHGSGHGHGRGHGVDPMGAYTAKPYGPWHDDIMMMMTIWPGHVAGHIWPGHMGHGMILMMMMTMAK